MFRYISLVAFTFPLCCRVYNTMLSAALSPALARVSRRPRAPSGAALCALRTTKQRPRPAGTAATKNGFDGDVVKAREQTSMGRADNLKRSCAALLRGFVLTTRALAAFAPAADALVDVAASSESVEWFTLQRTALWLTAAACRRFLLCYASRSRTGLARRLSTSFL